MQHTLNMHKGSLCLYRSENWNAAQEEKGILQSFSLWAHDVDALTKGNPCARSWLAAGMLSLCVRLAGRIMNTAKETDAKEWNTEKSSFCAFHKASMSQSVNQWMRVVFLSLFTLQFISIKTKMISIMKQQTDSYYTQAAAVIKIVTSKWINYMRW